MKKINIILLIFILSFVSGISHAQYLKELKIKNDYSIFKDTVPLEKSYSEKSPVLAGVLSFIVPGIALGQLYNKQTSKFIVHICISIVCYVGITFGIQNLNIDMGGKRGGSDAGNIAFLISAGIFVGNWIWSIVDAVISANKINKQIQLQKYRSGILEKLMFGLTLDKNKQLNLKFAFEL